MERDTLRNALLAAAFLLGACVVGFSAAAQPDFHFPQAGARVYERAVGASSQPAPARVNINTAGLDELVSLPGVGEKTAAAILDYRREHGRFLSRKDLLKVKGIGEKTYEKIKDLVTT